VAVRRRVVVSGDVQGVFFRDSCKRRAQQKGVAGAARNLPDGRVEVLFEGDDGAVEDMVAWCREGPRHAHVTKVEVEEQEPRGDSGFSVA
jgi:acylphosphatase